MLELVPALFSGSNKFNSSQKSLGFSEKKLVLNPD